MGNGNNLSGLTLKIVDADLPKEVPLKGQMEAVVRVGTIVIVDLAPSELPDGAEELGTLMCHEGLVVNAKKGKPTKFSNTIDEPLSAFCERFYLKVEDEESDLKKVKIFIS